MASLVEEINKLEYIKRLSQNPSSFTDAELKEQPTDTPLIKALKKKVQAEKDTTSWQTTYELERDKVKDRDKQAVQLGQEINDKQDQINTLNNDKTNLANEKKQLTNERDNLQQDKIRLTNELTTKQGELTNLQTQLTTVQSDLKNTQTEITNKDNRIAQLDQTVKDSALIFQKQINIIDGLTSQLQQARQQSIGNADYQTHLKEDIKRLAQERKDLTKQQKDLEKTKKDSENLRDQEIADLRTQIIDKQQELNDLINDISSLLVPILSDKTLANNHSTLKKQVQIIINAWEHNLKNTKKIVKERDNAVADLKTWTNVFPSQTSSIVKSLTITQDEKNMVVSVLNLLTSAITQDWGNCISESNNLGMWGYRVSLNNLAVKNFSSNLPRIQLLAKFVLRYCMSLRNLQMDGLKDFHTWLNTKKYPGRASSVLGNTYDLITYSLMNSYPANEFPNWTKWGANGYFKHMKGYKNELGTFREHVWQYTFNANSGYSPAFEQLWNEWKAQVNNLN